MKWPRLIAVMSCLAILCGCIPSLHPLYTDGDLSFEPELIGKWADKDGKDIWHFEKSGEKEYTLTYTDNKKKEGTFSVHLLKLGDALYLDLFPEKPEMEANDFYQWHLLPVHTFMKVRQITPTLQMAMVDPDELKKILEENPDDLNYDEVSERLTLTASTKELQAFFRKHSETEGLFGNFSDMRRVEE